MARSGSSAATRSSASRNRRRSPELILPSSEAIPSRALNAMCESCPTWTRSSRIATAVKSALTTSSPGTTASPFFRTVDQEEMVSPKEGFRGFGVEALRPLTRTRDASAPRRGLAPRSARRASTASRPSRPTRHRSPGSAGQGPPSRPGEGRGGVRNSIAPVACACARMCARVPTSVHQCSTNSRSSSFNALPTRTLAASVSCERSPRALQRLDRNLVRQRGRVPEAAVCMHPARLRGPATPTSAGPHRNGANAARDAALATDPAAATPRTVSGRPGARRPGRTGHTRPSPSRPSPPSTPGAGQAPDRTREAPCRRRDAGRGNRSAYDLAVALVDSAGTCPYVASVTKEPVAWSVK